MFKNSRSYAEKFRLPHEKINFNSQLRQSLSKALKVIIADDDRMTRSVLRLLLMEHRFVVVGEATDGEKAVELCESIKPDIAFIDINMPNLDGHGATGQIRKKCPKTRIIMISSLSTLSNVQQAMKGGANGFVVKPFNAVKVMEAIDHCLKTAP